MNRLGRTLFFIMLGGLLLPYGLRAQDKNQQKAPAGKTAKEKKQSLGKLEKELATPYKKWLEEEVPYIITNEERSAFLQLQTNEEREQFIETFWQRRNPDPDSADNEFKEEHYRRIAYANEKFASGIPGWKTDRGRMYIMWGPPDSIDVHTQGSNYNRPESEGGGSTTVYAFDVWNYRHMEGIGDNVDIEFVDPSGTGEFHIALDPGEKDALKYIPGAGASEAEQQGYANYSDRFNRTDGSTAPCPIGGCMAPIDAANNEFSRLDQWAKIQAPPPAKFKDLAEIVSSRIVRNQIFFDFHTDYMRITSETILVPITVQIQNKQLTFKSHDGVHSATLNLYARISTLSGRVVQTFEDTVHRDFPDSLLESSLKGYAIYQKAVPLRPGLYKLDLVIKDVNSDNVGVLNTRLAVSEMPDDQFEASSLILADQMEAVSSQDIGVGQFVLGSTKVRPKLNAEFKGDQSLGIYMQLYNLKVDDKTHKNDLSLDIKVTQGQQTVSHDVKTGDQLKQNGEQVTVQQMISAKSLRPGKYRIEIQATDQLTKQTVSRGADFTITPADPGNATVSSATGR